VSNGNLLSIGAFSSVTGLSISALRYYDEVGLLKPAFVDPITGYRYYLRDQIHDARLISSLRKVDLPIDAVREVLDEPEGEALCSVLTRHREQLMQRSQVLSQMIRLLDQYIEKGVAMPELKTPRIVQVTIKVTNLPDSIRFYQTAFEATFNEEISSFQMGAWPSDEFFLLTVEQGEENSPTGLSRFGLLVDDVDAVHRRALDAGATEVQPPMDAPWKPRSSFVADPSGNQIDLFQG
jgi:DNA-binding transcriptional MerR regulator